MVATTSIYLANQLMTIILVLQRGYYGLCGSYVCTPLCSCLVTVMYIIIIILVVLFQILVRYV